ncbi:proto-oncogene tyrosine-protein kinase ros, partial [Lasius niger]
MNRKYRFRVKAENVYGFGEWSEESAVVDLTEFFEPSTYPLILWLVVTIVINVCYFYRYITACRQRKATNEQVLPSTMTDVELATRYEMPYGNIQRDALYASRLQNEPDEFALTIIKKKQIILSEHLGSGTFGKVFKATVKNLEGSDTTPVAIKMLHKNASPQDKEKFKQEAKLMSQFRHEHVLKLLGICLDADSPLIILELMDAGDLLKYLRESRTLQPSDSHALHLQDLLAMCEDVARGCCYLEKMHFVHRDLACRNCLISARNRENRIVKIGDFGLARDIYEDDYYRMEGEGRPLPVRWMAPESLKYRIYTSKSDVWAFGVLMWEITSLGEHPYGAKNSPEVMQYVCEGGKLSKPLSCPSTLYQLMQDCWSAVDDRPKFIFCLKNIIMVRKNIEDATLSSTDNIRHAEVIQGTVKDLEESDTTPVAIKMLRENASSQEKKKFLQEAELMSHFRHKHVLRLLGICLDADLPLLILELMEVGDLLKYLRESQTFQPSDPHALRLQDLLAMCEDLARGKRRPASCSLDGTGIFEVSNIYIKERCLSIRDANVGNYVIG